MYLSRSEIYQLDLLKHKTPQERFHLMVGLIDFQFKIMLAGLKYINPEANEKELQKCLKERMIKIYSLKH